MQLSEHFSLPEMTATATGLPNTPDEIAIGKLRTLCVRVLEPVRAHFARPVIVHSGFRSIPVNDAVGGARDSQHPRGEAGDIEIAGVANPVLAAYIRDHVAFDQLILEAYRPGDPSSGWVHVSYREARLRHSVLTMTMGSHGPVYAAGIVA